VNYQVESDILDGMNNYLKDECCGMNEIVWNGGVVNCFVYVLDYYLNWCLGGQQLRYCLNWVMYDQDFP
jgi:hypothetical protein